MKEIVLSDLINQQKVGPYQKFLCTRQISQNPYPIRILPS